MQTSGLKVERCGSPRQKRREKSILQSPGATVGLMLSDRQWGNLLDRHCAPSKWMGDIGRADKECLRESHLTDGTRLATLAIRSAALPTAEIVRQ
jgi:hypothetical protein